MNRRQLLKTSLLGAAAMPAFASPHSTRQMLLDCGCAPMAAAALALPSAPRLKVTGMKVVGVSPPFVPRDRPYVFVKIETDVGVTGWGRLDLIVDADGAPWFLDVNTCPGMTSHSLVPMAANAVGVDFPELCWRILETSLR